MNKNDVTSSGLSTLGFSQADILIYTELLKRPASHARLSLLTNINRTTLYRLVSKLEKRGIVTQCLDDTGKLLIAADPSTLEVEVVNQEEQAKRQRAAFSQILPRLEDLKGGYAADFAIHTFEDVDGFKRMLWHELKAKGDCLSMGGAPLEELGVDHRWAEKYRSLIVEANYRVLELSNPGTTPGRFSDVSIFLDAHWIPRVIPQETLPINHLTTIYNDTVAIYNVYEGRRIGLEIVSRRYAQTARCIFEQSWEMAAPMSEQADTKRSPGWEHTPAQDQSLLESRHMSQPAQTIAPPSAA